MAAHFVVELRFYIFPVYFAMRYRNVIRIPKPGSLTSSSSQSSSLSTLFLAIITHALHCITHVRIDIESTIMWVQVFCIVSRFANIVNRRVNSVFVFLHSRMRQWTTIAVWHKLNWKSTVDRTLDNRCFIIRNNHRMPSRRVITAMYPVLIQVQRRRFWTGK